MLTIKITIMIMFTVMIKTIITKITVMIIFTMIITVTVILISTLMRIFPSLRDQTYVILSLRII